MSARVIHADPTMSGPADGDEETERINPWQSVAGRQGHDLLAMQTGARV